MAVSLYDLSLMLPPADAAIVYFECDVQANFYNLFSLCDL